MEKLKNNEKPNEKTEEMLSEYFADPVDSRFGKHLGQRLQERARAMHMEKLIRPEKEEKPTFGQSLKVMAKWQLAFLASFIGVLVVGVGVVMAVPALREKVLSAFAQKGTVIVSSSPSDAEVWIGPVMYGTTPTEVKVKEGSHELKVSKQGFEDYVQNIQVVSGEVISTNAVLTEQENPLKYSRDETWNLFQDPNLVYQIYFPYDWEYEWEESETTFTWGETIYTSIYYSTESIPDLEKKLVCDDVCTSQTVQIPTTAEAISAEKFVGVSSESGREITLLLVPTEKLGLEGYLVLESNSQLADEFIEKLKLFTDGINIDWREYQNEAYGFSFNYPSDWELYALEDESFVQASTDGGLFSVTAGGVYTEADYSVKNEEILIKIGAEVHDATKRYYPDQDYYVIQANIVKEGYVYGLEIRHENDKWIKVIDEMLSSFVIEEASGVVELSADEYGEQTYSLSSIEIATDTVYPDNHLRCGDGLMIVGEVVDTNGAPVKNGAVKLFVDKGEGDQLVGFPIEVSDGNFVIPATLSRHQLFSQHDSTCSLGSIILKLYGPATDNLIWSQEYQNLSSGEFVSTGVQGVVKLDGVGISDIDVDIVSNDELVVSGKSGAGGYFIFSVPEGSYVIYSADAEVSVEVTENFITYVSLDITEGAGDEEAFGAGDEAGGEGTIMGYVHDGVNLMAEEDVQIFMDGSLYDTVQTDGLGRFKVENLPSNTTYTVKVSGKTISYTRWEINIEGKHILPAGGTLRVEVVIE